MAISRICSIENCGKPAFNGRGWCSMHYQRWRTHGDPLAGRTPNGEAFRYFEDVVMTYEGTDCLRWPFGARADGYGVMNHEGRLYRVHRQVCERVHGPAPTPDHEAAHSCGKGHEGCCAKRHLSWKTPKANTADKLIHSTILRGERHGSAKLTEPEARRIFLIEGHPVAARNR